MGTNIFFLTKKFFFLFLVLFASAVKKWYSYLCGDTRHEKGSSWTCHVSQLLVVHSHCHCPDPIFRPSSFSRKIFLEDSPVFSLQLGTVKRDFFFFIFSVEHLGKNGSTNADSQNWRGMEGHSLPRAVSDPSPERNWVGSQSLLNFFNYSLSLPYHLIILYCEMLFSTSNSLSFFPLYEVRDFFEGRNWSLRS